MARNTTPLRYFIDRQGHLVCLPYSIENMYSMARRLRFPKGFVHDFGRWPRATIPPVLMLTIRPYCETVSTREIVRIIRSEIPWTPAPPSTALEILARAGAIYTVRQVLMWMGPHEI